MKENLQLEKMNYNFNSIQKLLRDNNYSMTLSPHRQHKIYIAATMEYGLGSEDPEELAYYNRIRKEIKKDRNFESRGIERTD
tara:strand:+ start:183 stop:428 length:246 start_codon:yes stop_codon:yes gene_type:complete